LLLLLLFGWSILFAFISALISYVEVYRSESVLGSS